MTLLTFNSKYVVQSTIQVQTTSSTLGDDTQASQTFTLSATQTILAIYQANNLHGSTQSGRGHKEAINVDGTDYANSADSPNSSTYAVRNCIFWIGSLGSGGHTIKGRFASNSNLTTSSIDNRILLIYILNGDEFQYLDDATAATTSSSTLGNDPNASFTFTPSGNCVALYLYNVTNFGATEIDKGKKSAINIAGTDYSQAEKGSNGNNERDSVFTCYANSLTAVSTTVTGRFATNSDTNTVTINRRQLGVLLFANSTLLDIITSDTQVSTTSSSLINDTQATINRTTTDTRELLVIAMGTKRDGTSSNGDGECYGIMTNSADRQNSRGSISTPTYADSVATCYAQTLTSGSHTIQGRFSNNTNANNALIDSRRVIALWLSSIPPTIRGISTIQGIATIQF